MKVQCAHLLDPSLGHGRSPLCASCGQRPTQPLGFRSIRSCRLRRKWRLELSRHTEGSRRCGAYSSSDRSRSTMRQGIGRLDIASLVRPRRLLPHRGLLALRSAIASTRGRFRATAAQARPRRRPQNGEPGAHEIRARDTVEPLQIARTCNRQAA